MSGVGTRIDVVEPEINSGLDFHSDSGHVVTKRSNGSKRVRTYFKLPSMAKQSFREECDINVIMKKYEKTGVIAHAREFEGRYGDYTNVQDYQESLNQVMAAQEMFMTLPATVRREFDNDPAKFLAGVEDPAMKDRLVELGLISPDVSGETNGVEEPELAPAQLPT